MDPARRALADEKYAQMAELISTLPAEAREMRFAVFDARWRTGAKADFQPLEKILYSTFKENNFGDVPTLASYLLEKFGEGKYLIEAQDEHNQRLIKIPTWTVIAGDENMDEDPRDRSPRRRRFRDMEDADFDDDDLDDDPRSARANAADMIAVAAKVNAAQAASVRNDSQQLMSMLLMTQQGAEQRRAEEERRREEQRADERRREEQRAEERRREEREEQRRHDEKLEREREERRRESEKADQLRREETQRAIEAANARTQMVIGALTTLAPLVSKVFEKKEDPTIPILLKMTEKKDADPITVMLMKSILDKSSNDDAGKMMVQNMGEMMKVSATMSAEQMKSLMAMSSDINSTVMKKAMEMMLSSPQGQTEEGKSMIEQVMGAIAGASEIVKALVPGKQVVAEAPPMLTAPVQPAPQQAPTTRHRLTAPAPAAGPAAAPAAADTRSAAEKEWDAMTPEQRAAVAAQVPSGTAGTLIALQAIQEKRYHNQAELQGLVQFAITSMPDDLQDAILAGNEMAVLAIAGPVIEQHEAIKTWAMSDGVLPWIRSYVSQLAPSIEAVRKMQQQAAANTAPAEAPAAAPAAEPVAAPVETPAEPAGDLAIAPSTEAEVTPPPVSSTGSHLEEDV